VPDRSLAPVYLRPLYRLTFRYPEAYRGDEELLLLADGRAEGRVAGRFRATNRARRRADGTFLPALDGAIVTEDGANVLVRLTGYGQPEGDPGRVLAAVTHSTGDERYAWLNGVLGVVAGEVRGGREIVLDVAELVWEPLDATITS
jgi:hypothetical protein